MPRLSLLHSLILAFAIGLAQPACAGSLDDIIAGAANDDTARVIDLLKRGMDVNTADSAGNTLLMIAARNGNADLLDFLIRNRSNLNKRNRFGDSAIMLGAFQGHIEIVRKLLDAGADTANKGWNALHYAAYAGFTEIASLLVERKIDLDARAPNGQTALMLAAKNGRLEIVRNLIDADADMDLSDPEGQTAIMLAQKAEQTEVVKFLKESGADEE